MKKVTKMTVIILTMLMILSMVTVPVIAAGVVTIGNVDIDPTYDSDAGKEVQKIGNRVIGILQVVGIFLSVIILVVLGIKYMMGSAEEKAEYKKTLLPYFIGAVLIFAASALAGVVIDWAGNLVPGTASSGNGTGNVVRNAISTNRI